MQQTIPVNDAWISSHVGATPSTGPFQIDFPFFSLNDVTVTRQADGSLTVEALTRGADYDIVGVATEDGSFSSGTVTLYLAVANSTVTRFRTTPIERLSNFPLQGFFSRLALNAELNKITVWMQELNGLLGTTSEASQAHAPLVSPNFVGDPKAPTPLAGDNDTSIATTAFVQTAMVGVGAAVPSGVIVDYAGLAAPVGWLLCTGQTLNRAAYPGLFAALGTTYNVGGEAGTDFRLPDLRGRVTAAPDSSGSGRLTAAGAGFDGTIIGASGGVQTHALTTAQSAAHNHTYSDPGHIHSVGPSGTASLSLTTGDVYWSRLPGGTGTTDVFYYSSVAPAAVGITINSTGGGAAHQNTQPTIVLNKIIKT